MAINPLYIPLFTLNEVQLDKDTGLPLSGGVVSFFSDAQRGTSKDVFQISGTYPSYTFTNVGSVLTLGLNGTFVDGSGNNFVPYAYPYDADGNVDLYYITVFNSGAVEQFTREAVPYLGESVNPGEQMQNTDNALSNPQFVEVNFPITQTVVLSVTGSNTVTPIAPGWDIISSGTDTITLQVLQPTTSNVPTNPPYALSILAGSGLGSSVTLRQRLYNTPSFMRGSYASGSFTAAIIAGGDSGIGMVYAPSTGSSTSIIPVTSILNDGAYHTISNNAQIPQQANDPASIGYADILLSIPTARTIAITSIQVVPVGNAINIPFDQQTAGRQKDHLFHYYENSILREPKNSILVGWNFALNPWQFVTKSLTNAAANQYIADQTILIQQNYVASATGNNVSTGQAGFANNFGLQITAVTAHNNVGLLQYIDPVSCAPYWGSELSVMVKAALTTTHGTNVQFKMRLVYIAALPNIVSQTDPVASWAEGGDPVAQTGYTFIAPPNDPVYTLGTTPQYFAFDGIQLPASTNANMTLGILVYTISNMNQAATADFIVINDISLVNNDFALPTQAQTEDEVLRKCQYYYEMSYDNYAATLITPQNSNAATGISNAGSIKAAGMDKPFKVTKRAVPTLGFYSPKTGTASTITDIDANVDITVTGQYGLGTKSTGIPTFASTGLVGRTLACQWVADARLGI